MPSHRRQKLLHGLYQRVAKPILFKLEAETAHNLAISIGEFMGKTPAKRLVNRVLAVDEPILKQRLFGIDFANPIGLAAGFDYNGRVAEILPQVGFGFNTIGTVTAQPYSGNPTPRLTRLIESKSILVNKGFKSDGAIKVAERLAKKDLSRGVAGISVGSSNLPEISTLAKAIEDYLVTFVIFKDKPYLKYFELNISCPNTLLTENFAQPEHFRSLLEQIATLKLKKPVFVKMPSDIAPSQAGDLMKIGLQFGHTCYIFSNLLKKQRQTGLSTQDKLKIEGLTGGISGRPTFQASNKLIGYARQAYGSQITIIGCGGVFSAEDAYQKIKLGANLVQLVTGLIFMGPQLVGEINYGLAGLLKKDGYESLDQAVGSAWRSRLHP